MHRWAEGLLTHPVAIMAWSVALLLAGGWAALQVPLEWVPQVELPEVRVSASWGGASPRSMERYVTAPIERAAGRVPGTAGIESVSQEGQTTITLQVAEGTDLAAYTARVSDELALLRDVLPDRVTPRLSRTVPQDLRSEQGFMTIQLIGPQQPGELRHLAEDQIAPALMSLAGVAEVDVRGGTEQELLVTLDQDKLQRYDLPPQRAEQALREATADAAYGRLAERGRSILLLKPAETDISALRDLTLDVPGDSERPLRLRDIATVRLQPAPLSSISRIDGDPVITLNIDRAPGSHLIDVANNVERRLASQEERLPEGTRLIVADDRSEDVRAELWDLSWRGGLGLALVVLVLLMMLKSVRATLVVVFSVAVALAVALALMGPLGLTLNLLTLAGLVLVFGLLVDNSVVTTEQLILWRARMRARGLSGLELEARSTAEALRGVWLPLVGGTLTTMAVMLPLVYLSGELRALFLPFGVLVALTLAASLLSAGALVPVLGRFLPEPREERRLPRLARRAIQLPYALTARFPKASLAALFLLLGTPLWLLPPTLDGDADAHAPTERLKVLYDKTLGSEFVQDAREHVDPLLGGVMRPFIEEADFGAGWNFEARPEVYARLSFPPGNPIERADSLISRFEQLALASPSVSRTLVNVSETSARLRVQFYDEALLEPAPYILREELIQEAVLLAGISVSVGGLLPQSYYSGSGAGVSGYRVVGYGPNYEDLERLMERFAERLQSRSRRVAGVDLNAGRGMPREVLTFDWGPEAEARSGAAARDLASLLSPVFRTSRTALRTDLAGEPELPVRIVVGGAAETDVDRLASAPFALGNDRQVKLSALADYTIEETPARIERENQRYRREMRIDYRGPGRMGRELLESELEGFVTPAGYELTQERTSFFTEEVQQAFWYILLATLALVFLSTAAVFESWRLPLVVLLSLPLAGVGVALGFLWTDAVFAEGAFIGVVLLVGIAANDAILLVHRYGQLRAERPHGASGPLARLAARERLRPMWTTTLSTCVAMLPLLVFPDGSEFWTGLAVTVTGGLLAATILSPPAAVALLSLRKRPDPDTPTA